MSTTSKLRTLQHLAELKQSRALAAHAQLNLRSQAMRSQINASRDELTKARTDSAQEPFAHHSALERFERWSSQHQRRLSTDLAAIEAERLSARDQAQIALGRSDTLTKLMDAERSAEQKRSAARQLDDTMSQHLSRQGDAHNRPAVYSNPKDISPTR